MIFKLFLVLLSCSVFAGNSRLDRILRYRDLDLECTIENEVNRILSQAAVELKWQLDSISAKIDTIVDEVKKDKTHSFNHKLRNMSVHYGGYELFIQELSVNIGQIQFERNRIPKIEELGRDRICTAYRDLVAFPSLAEQPAYSEIIIDIPKPQILHQTGVFDSEHKPAEEAGTAIFSIGSGGGCFVGGAMGSEVPVLGTVAGCVAGFMIGSLLGLGGGAATSAIMTAKHNNEEIDAYNNAFRREEARQKAEIKEVDEWLKAHPIDAQHIYARVQAICLAKGDWSVFTEAERTIPALLGIVDSVIVPALQKELEDAKVEFNAFEQKHRIYMDQQEASKAYVAYFDEYVEPLLESESELSILKKQIARELKYVESRLPDYFLTHKQILDRKKKAQKFLGEGEES